MKDLEDQQEKGEQEEQEDLDLGDKKDVDFMD